jgi:hypothetical protein
MKQFCSVIQVEFPAVTRGNTDYLTFLGIEFGFGNRRDAIVPFTTGDNDMKTTSVHHPVNVQTAFTERESAISMWNDRFEMAPRRQWTITIQWRCSDGLCVLPQWPFIMIFTKIWSQNSNLESESIAHCCCCEVYTPRTATTMSSIWQNRSALSLNSYLQI